MTALALALAVPAAADARVAPAPERVPAVPEGAPAVPEPQIAPVRLGRVAAEPAPEVAVRRNARTLHADYAEPEVVPAELAPRAEPAPEVAVRRNARTLHADYAEPEVVPAELAARAEPAPEVAVRRNARTLHAACAELIPGYAKASREPWRQALLTAGCLDGRPRRPAPRRPAPALIVEDVVQPSDVLCALWLARRCGLFSPGSSVGDGVGLRSACDLIPAFAPSTTAEQRTKVMATLRANAAWRAHLLARAG